MFISRNKGSKWIERDKVPKHHDQYHKSNYQKNYNYEDNCMPALSIIVPVYNVEKYLHRCIDSILAQTFTDFELILVDDGSTDESNKICDEYASKDPRILIIHKENGGVSSARNMGMCFAEGEYLAFVDADDYLDSDLYERAIAEMSNKDIVFFHYMKKEGKCIRKIYQKNLALLKENTLNFLLFYTNYPVHNTGDVQYDDNVSVFCFRAVYRREFVKKHNVSFDESLMSGEDRIFLFNLFLYNPQIAVNNHLFGYYYDIRGQESLTGAKTLTKYNPTIFLRFKNMDIAEQEVCKKNSFLTDSTLEEIRLQRAAKMRELVILNECKYNRRKMREAFQEFWKDDFFRFAFRFKALWYTFKHGSASEIIKFLLIKFRMYRLVSCIYYFSDRIRACHYR